MPKNITKSIYFNLEDEFHLELLKFAKEKRNFSNYVKRLIYDDMKSAKKKKKKEWQEYIDRMIMADKK